MNTKGLSKERILSEAVLYIENTGQPTISLHELARKLEIKTPSLYNHIKNTKELQYELFEYAIQKFVEHQRKATENLHRDDAVRAFADAYYMFAKSHKGLYKLIMSLPSNDDKRAQRSALPLLSIIVEILSQYDLEQESIAHWQRVLRAILHGFLSEEELGYFYYYQSIDLKKSREIAVQCFLDGLHAEISSKK